MSAQKQESFPTSGCIEDKPDYWHNLGLQEEEKGNHEGALQYFIEATRRVNRVSPSFQKMQAHSHQLFRKAQTLIEEGKSKDAIPLLVRAIELNPDFPEMKSTLECVLRGDIRPQLQLASPRLPSAFKRYVPKPLKTALRTLFPKKTLSDPQVSSPLSTPPTDFTKHCFISQTPERTRAIHYETYLRSIEYLTYSGIVGDVLEFGVLGGWSARLYAEIMRDRMFFGNLHLFDSFEGLPVPSAEPDKHSYELGEGRNIWDNMKFSDEFIEALGSSIEDHIDHHLQEVLSKDRIHIYKGFYDRTLQTDLKLKAALVHIDCDMYSSTVDVLEGLAKMNAFQDGCVLIFDDWNCHKANPNFGERRAFREFLEKYANLYEATPFFTYGWCGAVYILHHKQ